MSNLKLITLTNRLLQQNAACSSLIRTTAYSTELPKDVPTHTGQQWANNDYRMVRFTNVVKNVNKQYAIKLIAEVPPKVCKERIVSCNGGGGPLGHPKVYINLDKPGNHACGYCGLRFVKEDHHH